MILNKERKRFIFDRMNLKQTLWGFWSIYVYVYWHNLQSSFVGWYSSGRSDLKKIEFFFSFARLFWNQTCRRHFYNSIFLPNNSQLGLTRENQIK